MNKSAKEITYRTIHNLPKAVGMPTGTQYDNEYGYTIKENLIKGLEKTGEINRYEMIQRATDECKIETILAKAAVDPTILQQRKGMFLDTTSAPKSLAEFENLRIKVIQEFGKLDVETRKKFDNSPEKFVAEYGTEEWAKKVGIESPEDLKTAIDVVKETTTPVETPNPGKEETPNE